MEDAEKRGAGGHPPRSGGGGGAHQGGRRGGGEKPAGPQPQRISPEPSRTTGSSQPAEMTSVPHPQAGEDGRSQGFTLRERAACLQLGCFHLLTRSMGLGTHPAKPYLRRIWFAPLPPSMVRRL